MKTTNAKQLLTRKIARLAYEGSSLMECRTLAHDEGRRLGMDILSILEALNDGFYSVDSDLEASGERV